MLKNYCAANNNLILSILILMNKIITKHLTFIPTNVILIKIFLHFDPIINAEVIDTKYFKCNVQGYVKIIISK